MFKGFIKEGKWMRVRDGITMDSSCAVPMMPSDWLTMLALAESEGSKACQTYVAAAKDGKPIKNKCQRTINFFTLEGERKRLTCQVAGVNKIIASLAMICDNGNEVLFKDTGGDIINIAAGKRTAFRRLGNIYVLDAWIPCPDVRPEPKNTGDEMLSFIRPCCSR